MRPTTLMLAAAMLAAPLAGDAQDVPRWKAVERLSIGAADATGGIALGRVRRVAVRADGTVIVPDEMENAVHAFDSSGRRVWTTGRNGAGPGEFQHLSALAVLGDTVFVADLRLARLTALGPDGNVIRTLPMPINAARAGFITRIIAAAPGRYVFQSATGCRVPRVAGVDDRWHLSAWTEGAPAPVALLSHEYGTSAAIYGETFCGTMPIPFGRTPVMATGSTGRLAIVDPDDASVSLYDSPTDGGLGAPVLKITPAWTPRPVTSTDMKLYRDSVLGLRDQPAGNADLAASHAAAQRDRLASMTLPTTWPLITDALIDDAGGIWLRRSVAFRDRQAEWVRFDAKGAPEGSVALPVGFEVHAFRGGNAYGVSKDDLDVQSVKRFEICRRCR